MAKVDLRRIGHKHSEETKKKISNANKGRIFSDAWIHNLSLAHKGQVSHRKGKKFVDEEVSRGKRKKYIKEWKIKNKDRILGVSRIWAKKNIEKLATRARLRYQKNPQKELDRVRFKKYGISGDEYREIIKKQGERCPICGNSILKNLSVDHDHVTGKIRGLICNACNLAIANAGDSPDRLRAMAEYLEKIHET